MKINKNKLKQFVREETKAFLLKKAKVIAEQDVNSSEDGGTKKIIRGKAAEKQEKIKQYNLQKEKQKIQKALALGYLKRLHGYFIKNFYNRKLNEQFDAGITFSTLLNFKDKFDLSRYLPSKEDIGEIQKVEKSLKDILNSFFVEAASVKQAVIKNKKTYPEKWGDYDQVTLKAIDEYIQKVRNLAIAAKKIMSRVKKLAELTKLEDATQENIWKDYKKASDELTKGEGGDALLRNILAQIAFQDS